MPSRTERVAMTAELYAQCQGIRTEPKMYTMDHKPLKLQFCTGDLNHIDMHIPTHVRKSNHEHKLFWKDQAAGTLCQQSRL